MPTFSDCAPRVLANEIPGKSLRDEQLKLMDEVKMRTGSTHPFFWKATTFSGRNY
jgi:hypothetical protein